MRGLPNSEILHNFDVDNITKINKLVSNTMKIFHNIFCILLINLIVQIQLIAMDLPSKHSFLFEYGAATAGGSQNAFNEDRYICCELEDINGPVTFAAIFDGHNGCNVAQDLHDNFCSTLKECAEGKTFFDTKVVGRAFKRADARVKWIKEEGATALVVIMQGNKLLIAHVGHSRAVIYANDGQYHYVKKTRDHRADDSYEMERIYKNDGRITNNRSSLGDYYIKPTEYYSIAGNICRVKSGVYLSISRSNGDCANNSKNDGIKIFYKKGGSLSTEGSIFRDRYAKLSGAHRIVGDTFRIMGTMNLSITRSIGDYCARGKKDKGIICEPDILERMLDENYKFIILASHGVWDAFSSMPNAPVFGVREVLASEGPAEAAQRLIEVAQKIQPPYLHDDMTVIIIKIY